METTAFFWSRHSENDEFESIMREVIHSGDLVLDVGCGDIKVDDRLLGVDAYSDAPCVNLQAYMWDMPFGDNSVDGIFCMMALEHISKFQVMPTLAEFERVLKPGARFIILVPNLIWVMERFIENPNPEWEMDMLFGIQTHEGEFHKTGFTRDIIKRYFDTAAPNTKIINIYDVNAYNQMGLGIVAQKVIS